MNVLIYARVSTEEQAREGHSIAAQKERLISFCKAQGWDIYNFYIDEGYSGAKIDRPALNQLRQDVAEKKGDVVLVWKVDRLSRKVSHLSALVEEFDRYGVGLRSMTEPFNTSHASGRAFLHMLSTFAELERETIRERTKMGIRQRIKEGYTHGRPAPFGYRWSEEHKGLLEIYEPEAEVVRYIYRRYLEGAGVMQIAREVSQMKGPTPATQKAGLHYDRVTSLQDRVRWMLHNPIYAGYTALGDELYSGRHEAIIDPETYDRVQRIWEEERRVPNRAKRSTYVLSGLAVCGECGRSLSGYKQPRKNKAGKKLGGYYTYYICMGSTVVRGKAKACDNWGMRTYRVEDAVWDAIRRLPLETDEIAAAYEENTPQEPSEVDRLKKKLAVIRRKRTRWFQRFEDEPEVEELALQRLRELADQEKELLAAIEKLEARRPEVSREELLDIARRIDELIRDASPEDLRKLARIFVRQVRVYKDKHIEVDLYPL